MAQAENQMQQRPTDVRVFLARGAWIAWQPQLQEPVPISHLEIMLLATGCERPDNPMQKLAAATGSSVEVLTSQLKTARTSLSAKEIIPPEPPRDSGTEQEPTGRHRTGQDPHALSTEASLVFSTEAYVRIAAGHEGNAVVAGNGASIPIGLSAFAALLRMSSPISMRDCLETVRPSQRAMVEATLRRVWAAGALMDHAPVLTRNREKSIQPVSRGDSRCWTKIEPDGRIPIYFVTHSPDHLPLALGMLRATICADPSLLERYQPLPITWDEMEDLRSKHSRFGDGVWLFSNYIWSLDSNLRVSSWVNESLGGRNFTVHGGPSTPKYEAACAEFMASEPHVDVAIRGEGEAKLLDLLRVWSSGVHGEATLAEVTGITFRRTDGRLTRTDERPRIEELTEVRSPYLDGHFENYGGSVVAAILETNRGCPFACTFCDWGSATQSKIKRFDMDRVRAEIDWIVDRGIHVLWIADANFGVFPRDIEVAEHIAAAREGKGFPREVVVNYPKNSTAKIAEIVRILIGAGIAAQGIISIQTTDEATLKAIDRENIKTAKYDEMLGIFREQGLPISTDLMIGLPGATVESFKSDLQRYFDMDVTVKAYRTQLLPNSPMADPNYMEKYQIRTAGDGLLVSTSSYGQDDLSRMLMLWLTFDLCDGFGFARYIGRHLQWDHSIHALDLFERMADAAWNRPFDYPDLSFMLKHFNTYHRGIGDWRGFYLDLRRFIADEFDLQSDDALVEVIRLNESVMPSPSAHYPLTLESDFNLTDYFTENAGRATRTSARLADMPGGELRIDDPAELSELLDRSLEQYDNHQVFWELSSPVSRASSMPNWVNSVPKT
jgi:radical SAM superfamily enzyme YgiQ (UPF0313 family)